MNLSIILWLLERCLPFQDQFCPDYKKHSPTVYGFAFCLNLWCTWNYCVRHKPGIQLSPQMTIQLSQDILLNDQSSSHWSEMPPLSYTKLLCICGKILNLSLYGTYELLSEDPSIQISNLATLFQYLVPYFSLISWHLKN